MIVFPAIKAKMGSWDYFMVKMSMRELSENVKFDLEDLRLSLREDHRLNKEN